MPLALLWGFITQVFLFILLLNPASLRLSRESIVSYFRSVLIREKDVGWLKIAMNDVIFLEKN
jgi:hypothetical protein